MFRNLKPLPITLFLVLLCLCTGVKASAQKTYIVCVGLNVNRDNVNPLANPRADMRSIAHYFHNYNGSEVFMLLDANATRDHILKVLKKQFAKSTSNDEIIFAYSGHGFDGGVSTYNNDEVIYCSEIQQIMHKAKARRKMMFIMSCHSGSFTKKYNSTKDKRRQYNKKSSVLLFLSSQSDEYSWANPMMENSYFYHYLMKAFEGEADRNNDKKVTARELFNYVAPHVEESTDNLQHPVMWGRFSDDMVIIDLNNFNRSSYTDN